MSYTRECNSTDCKAVLTWDEENGYYVDSIFPKEKHNHKKFMSALAAAAEASNNGGSTPAKVVTKEEVPPSVEGVECNTCKANGFPAVYIFFNNAAKGYKTHRPIPLDRPDKVNGEFVFHEHRTKDDDNPPPPPTATVAAEPSTVTKVPQGEGVNFSQLALNDTIRAFTAQLNSQQKWFEDSRDKIDTILAYVLDQTVKKADTTK